MNKYPNVAVLIATYNGSDWIEAQISSVASQLECTIHIFVRDDCSTDKTLHIIDKFIAYGYPITIINSGECNTGSAGRNFFKLLEKINCIDFDYISFCDQDDVWFPDKLAAAMKLIKERKADVYSSNLIAFDNRILKSWVLNKCSEQKSLDYLFQGASAGCTYVLTGKAADVVKRVMGQELNNFPRLFSHDWTIYAICRSHGLTWVHDDRSFIAYRQHTRNVFGAKPGLVGLFSKIRMSNAGWYKSHVMYLRKLVVGSIDEVSVLNAIQYFSLRDRFFLISRVFKFRRSSRDSLLLAALFLTGFFK